MCRSRAFTLTEMLIVLAVIGLLAAGVLVSARKLAQVYGMRSLVKQIQTSVAAHSGFIGMQGAFTRSLGRTSAPAAMLGANFSTSDGTKAAIYADFRMVYVANELMRVDEVMFTVPTALRGGISGAQTYPKFELIAAQLSSTKDGLSWSMTPDTAITGASWPTLVQFLQDGQGFVACRYETNASLRPAPNGSARNGPALVFEVAVGASTYEPLAAELEEKLGRTNGYGITVSTTYAPNVYLVTVVSPKLSL